MIEIIATTPEDARKIELCGGDRIELVSALSEGGLTPSYGLIKKVVKSVSIPVNVMVRPHAKSFVYSDEELELMKQDIEIARELGANGVVFGTLNEKNEICEKSLEMLLEVSHGLEVTFHRAIDELISPADGAKILSKYSGITRILTSGGKGRIEENFEVIKNMIGFAGHIKILVGGGLNFENAREIIRRTGAPEFHFGTAVRYDKSSLKGISEEQLAKLLKIIKG